MDHNYLVPNFFHLYSQYEYNTELILTELILCSKLLQHTCIDTTSGTTIRSPDKGGLRRVDKRYEIEESILL